MDELKRAERLGKMVGVVVLKGLSLKLDEATIRELAERTNLMQKALGLRRLTKVEESLKLSLQHEIMKTLMGTIAAWSTSMNSDRADALVSLSCLQTAMIYQATVKKN